MTIYALDTETFYDKEYSVKTLGPVAYALDPRFDCYLVSIAGDDGFEWVGHPSKAPWDKISGHTWLSHNAAFDAAIFLRMQADGTITKGIAPTDWYCTADLMAYLQFPRSLADACKELFGATLNKAVRARQSGRNYPEEMLFDNELLDYALDDARWCLKLWINYGHIWPDDERRLSHLTRFWGMRGASVDLAKLDTDIATLERLRWEALNQIPWAEDGDTAVLSIRHLATACRNAGIEPPKSLAMSDEDCDEWLETYGDKYPWIGAMRQWRRTNMLISKYAAIKRRLDPKSGRMPYGMKYCGAQHTGRWSGDSGVNMQNLPKGDLFGANLRNCFIPAPGHKFIVADFSQIEPRVLAWLADDTVLLGQIAEHHDFYEAQARAMGMWSKPEPLRTDPATRHLVKGLNLGLGYGMSAARFATLTGLPMEKAEELVALYREKNKAVLKMWSDLELMAKRVTQRDDRTLTVELPSGRSIKYFNVRKDKGLSAEVVKGGRRTYIWGGFLTENMTQAVAREVFAAALLRVDAIRECRIVWHVHDEIICEVRDDLAASKQAEIERVMCEPPAWAADLPVAVESSIEERYTK